MVFARTLRPDADRERDQASEARPTTARAEIASAESQKCIRPTEPRERLFWALPIGERGSNGGATYKPRSEKAMLASERRIKPKSAHSAGEGAPPTSTSG